MTRKFELPRKLSEKEKINQLIDGFYIKNGKKEGEVYETVSEADWQLAMALPRLAESFDKLTEGLAAWREQVDVVTKKLLDANRTKRKGKNEWG
jgi:hypothetical protein